jgi:quinolinate synthase
MFNKPTGTVVLAHYYTSPEVQKMADFVADSLTLAQWALEHNPTRIIYASVRFMAETAKIMMPETQIILPHKDSTCSLVTQTDVSALVRWVEYEKVKKDKVIHVAYINSSAEHKTVTDIIVTSANVEDIVGYYATNGYTVLFSPDRNMGMYLKYIHPDWDIKVWNAVCEVHDKFKEAELIQSFTTWTDGPKYLIAHPESSLPILRRANMVGSTTKLLNYIKNFQGSIGTIFVATESNLLYNMKDERPDLDIRLAPVYSGCQCNQCPWMALNTPELVQAAIDGTAGIEIDYLTSDVISKARVPIERMLNFNGC